MSPLTWEELNRRKFMVRAYRGPIVSAYMKSVRLGRPEDAIYWMTVLWQGKAGNDYLRRRIFNSAGEDNLDPAAMERCEALILDKTEDPRVLAQAVFASTVSTKWYEFQDGQRYSQAHMIDAMVGHPDPGRVWTLDELVEGYQRALDRHEVARLFWLLQEARVLEIKLWPFHERAALAGEASRYPTTRQLAGVIRRQMGWLGATRERNHLWQLLWSICKGPLTLRSTPYPAWYTGGPFDACLDAALARLRAEIEAVPSWARDGVHVAGKDPRFAGHGPGVMNMIAMFQRDGRLDPAQPGIFLKEGQRWLKTKPSAPPASRARRAGGR